MIVFRSLLFTCLLVFTIMQASAQEFFQLDQTNNGGTLYHDIDILNTGNYVCTGLWYDGTNQFIQRMTTSIYSPTGQTLRTFTSNGNNDIGLAVEAAQNGDFLLSYINDDTPTPIYNLDSSRLYLSRYNSNGDQLWAKTYSTPNGYLKGAHDVLELSDGSFIVAAYHFVPQASTTNDQQLYIMKIDAAGNTLWHHTYGDTSAKETAFRIIQTSDGGFAISGNVLIHYTVGSNRTFALKLDSLGNRIWYKTYRMYDAMIKPRITETYNNNFLITGENQAYEASILKVNAQGDSLDLVSIEPNITPTTSHNYVNDIIANPDGTFMISGRSTVNSPASGCWLQKIDSQLSPLWERVFVNPLGTWGHSIISTPDEGYAIAGSWYTNKNNGLLIKTDSLGNIIRSVIEGELTNDLNANCIAETGEGAIINTLVKATVNNTDYYAISNAQGAYNIVIYDTGATQISTTHPSNFWRSPSCQNSNTTINTSLNDTTTFDLFLEPTILCPLLSVKLHNNSLRRCFTNNKYTVTYSNNGSVDAANAYIEIDFGTEQRVDSSSLPWNIPVNGTTYRFNLGNVTVGTTNNFYVWTSTDCDSVVLGQTICAEAHIYPDSICEPVDVSWDQSSLLLTSRCLVSDSISFTLINIGTGNMSAPSTYTIIENGTIVQQNTFQLTAGDVLRIKLPANGRTYTMIVPQSPGHPGQSAPLRVVEACGEDVDGRFDIGYLMQFPQDDQDPFVDILCGPIVGSFDPNNKLVEPQGFEASGNINADQDLDYTINFQNTGTDTAFLVVLRDTLSPYLDITSLQLTGSSHSYTFQIREGHILEWTFENIMLPDSNVNEPESLGFVSFTIDQIDSNAVGTEILNRAGIYFDFNEVVLTNYTTNTIVDDYKEGFTVSVTEIEGKADRVKLYPNPNSGSFNIELTQPKEGDASLMIFDLTGKLILERSLNTEATNQVSLPNLDSGIYFYSITQGNENISNGKILITK